MRVSSVSDRKIEDLTKTGLAQDEFVPFEHFARMMRKWWAIVLVAILGGLTGFGVHQFQPPLYEAQATFLASIDFNKVDLLHPPAPTPAPYQFTQYDEDISLVVVESSLRYVVPQVVEYARTIGLQVDSNTLLNQTTIERENAYWMLRFRSTDPVKVQKIVDYWADLGFADLQAKQKAGQLPSYIFFDLIQKADLPGSPRYFRTNVFVLAGAVIGLLVGVVLVNLPITWRRKGF